MRFVRPAAWEAAVDGEACSKTLPEVSLLCSGRLMRGMGIRAQIVRDLQGDERDEDSQQQCGKGNRAEARPDEGERY